jgi:predicted secreted protein
MVPVLLVAAAPDQAISVPMGEIIRVELEDVSASTGYRWQLLPHDQAVVTYTDTRVEPAPAPGAVGRRLFDFRAVATGSTVLRFELARSWEKAVSPLRRASVQVEVR